MRKVELINDFDKFTSSFAFLKKCKGCGIKIKDKPNIAKYCSKCRPKRCKMILHKKRRCLSCKMLYWKKHTCQKNKITEVQLIK